METAFAITLGIISLLAFLVMPFAWVYKDWKDNRHWRRKEAAERKAKEEESKLPIYERIALAYERKAAHHLEYDNPERAERYYREAQKVRDRAMQKIMNGELP